jgi:uncharacterized protein YihD (DUF1040 family)
MRDPARIDEVLGVIRELWREYPDWWLCQLIVNVAARNDPFYTEDDELVQRLKDWQALLRDTPSPGG